MFAHSLTCLHRQTLPEHCVSFPFLQCSFKTFQSRHHNSSPEYTYVMSTAHFTCWSILVNQLKRLLDSKFLRWSLGANQLSCPKSGPTDLTVLTIGSAPEPSKQWRSDPEAFRAGHFEDLTETGNRARKVSGTKGTGNSNASGTGSVRVSAQGLVSILQ